MDEKRFNRICKDIKSLKIQGARNIAKAALIAYSLKPSKKSKAILFNLRPTEPMLRNSLNLLDKVPKQNILKHFEDAQVKINSFIFKTIKQNDVILTHCHSSNVINALLYSKKHGKKFCIYNTETRPLYQGRKTATELAKAGINVTTIVESAVSIALHGEEKMKKIDKVFLGADAILKNGNVINKVGSGMFAEIAHDEKIPVYIIADSWKFSKRPVEIEEREHKEVWKNAPLHVKIRNPAFEVIDKKYIKSIISELGILEPSQFVKKVVKTYPMLK